MSKGNYELMDDEFVIFKTKRGFLIITNYRIRRLISRGKYPSFKSILLADVTTIASKIEENPKTITWGLMLILVGFVAAIAPVIPGWITQLGVIAIPAGIGLLLYYFTSRKHVVQFRSSSGVIEFEHKILGNTELMEIVDRIEHIKVNNHKKEVQR